MNRRTSSTGARVRDRLGKRRTSSSGARVPCFHCYRPSTAAMRGCCKREGQKHVRSHRHQHCTSCQSHCQSCYGLRGFLFWFAGHLVSVSPGHTDLLDLRLLFAAAFQTWRWIEWLPQWPCPCLHVAYLVGLKLRVGRGGDVQSLPSVSCAGISVRLWGCPCMQTIIQF